MMRSLTKQQRLEILCMKDKEGRTPVHQMVIMFSTAALPRVVQPLSDEENLSTLHSDSEIHPKVTQLEDWLKKQVADEYYALLIPPQALLFYNLKGREEKSEEEFESLRGMRTELGFPPQVVKDFTETGIMQKIRQAQSGTCLPMPQNRISCQRNQWYFLSKHSKHLNNLTV